MSIPAKLFAERTVVVVAGDLNHLKYGVGSTDSNPILRIKLGKHLTIENNASGFVGLADHDFIDTIRGINNGPHRQRVRADRRDDECLQIFTEDRPARREIMGRGTNWRTDDQSVAHVRRRVLLVDKQINLLHVKRWTTENGNFIETDLIRDFPVTFEYFACIIR